MTLIEVAQVEVVAGRMYTFPKGMSCTWEVHTHHTHWHACTFIYLHIHIHIYILRWLSRLIKEREEFVGRLSSVRFVSRLSSMSSVST